VAVFGINIAMTKYLLLAAGGAIGTMFRYGVSNIDYKYSDSVFPLGTFLVNVSGSLLIGFLWGVSERVVVSPKLRMFGLVGILGGYTTFSTYSLESFSLLRDGEYRTALGNIFLTNIVAIAFVFVGYFLSKMLMSALHKGG